MITNYQKIYSKVKQIYKDTHFDNGVFDETYFSLRVYETAKEIISKIKDKVD
jgi:hypothetical protein